MSFSKRFLKKMVSTVFAFNSFLFMGSDFIFQSSVSAHTVTIKEVFKDLIYQINLNAGYTGTGMPLGFSKGKEYVYIPCRNGKWEAVPRTTAESILCWFNYTHNVKYAWFHDLVSAYSVGPTVSSQMQYPTQEQVTPVPLPGQYSTPVPPTTPTPMQYPTQEQVTPAPLPGQYSTPVPLTTPTPMQYPTQEQVMTPTPLPGQYSIPVTAPMAPLSYIPPSTDTL